MAALDRRVVGQEGLQHDAARVVAAAGPAGDLRDELERPLGGAEVGQAQRGVAADHADERHVGVVEPLGDHLRAEHDLDLAAARTAEQRFVVRWRRASCRCRRGRYFSSGNFVAALLRRAGCPGRRG